MDQTARPFDVRRATRDSESPLLGGVCSGLAAHLGVPVMWVRLTFFGLVFCAGFGLALYAGLWLMLPSDQAFLVASPGLEAATRQGKRPSRAARWRDGTLLVVLCVLGLGLLLGLQSALGINPLVWPLLIGVAGIALIWRQADEVQQERWLDPRGRLNLRQAVVGSGGWAGWFRLVIGLLLIGFAVVASGSWPQFGNVLWLMLLFFAGLVLAIGPLVIRLVSDYNAERTERVRSQERADVASHLHDSVLQTLALIQRSAHDPSTVARLARSQERDLRAWLYADAPSLGGTLAEALREIGAQTEDDLGTPVDVITVGDTPVTEQLRPLIAAAREAVINAGKHAGAARIDVYAEVSPTGVECFVRDRGIGFDPAVIAEDRHGVRDSIVARMSRHGGRAEVVSAPGEGTNVSLWMPVTSAEQTVGEGNL